MVTSSSQRPASTTPAASGCTPDASSVAGRVAGVHDDPTRVARKRRYHKLSGKCLEGSCVEVTEQLDSGQMFFCALTDY